MAPCRPVNTNTSPFIDRLKVLRHDFGSITPILTVATLCAIGWSHAASAAETPSSVRPEMMTALDRYVAAPDTNFSFKVIDTVRIPGVRAHILQLTSQAWLTTNEVDRPVWKHWLVITRPDEITSSKALLFISGGSNDKGPPKGPSDLNIVRTATETKSVVVELRNVPTQPLIFNGDGQKRSEDALIAYTWEKFLRTLDDRWPARLPMTKSAVRAMDAVTAFCATPEGGGAKIDGFIVAGGSKRGWTTWTTAAVDKRVVAIVPIVIDVLNMDPSMQHHYAAYGFWAPAVGDYTRHHIMDWMGTAPMRALEKIEEPYQYRQRYTMPKLIVNATGDQFFLPDSAQFYFNELPGAKYLRYVPNADHSMKGTDAWESLQAFYQSILTGTPMPQFSWTLESDGSIKVKATDLPKEAKLWQATNPDARDFRLETFGPKWTSTPLTGHSGEFVGKVEKPARGWTAFMVELTYPRPNGTPLKLTTQVRVVPDTTNHKFVPRPPANPAN